MEFGRLRARCGFWWGSRASAGVFLPRAAGLGPQVWPPLVPVARVARFFAGGRARSKALLAIGRLGRGEPGNLRLRERSRQGPATGGRAGGKAC
jgi:hypothetical protein